MNIFTPKQVQAIDEYLQGLTYDNLLSGMRRAGVARHKIPSGLWARSMARVIHTRTLVELERRHKATALGLNR